MKYWSDDTRQFKEYKSFKGFKGTINALKDKPTDKPMGTHLISKTFSILFSDTKNSHFLLKLTTHL